MSYGGLRGAVAISLALALHVKVDRTIADGVSESIALQYSQNVNSLFGLVGGFAFLTLVINGSTSGLLLRRLGLAIPTECRKRVIESYHQLMAQDTLNEYVTLLTEKRFEDIDYAAVTKYIPSLKDLSYEKLMAAVELHKVSDLATVRLIQDYFIS